MFELKGTADELCLMALKIDAKFEEKVTSAFKNNMGDLGIFTG